MTLFHPPGSLPFLKVSQPPKTVKPAGDPAFHSGACDNIRFKPEHNEEGVTCAGSLLPNDSGLCQVDIKLACIRRHTVCILARHSSVGFCICRIASVEASSPYVYSLALFGYIVQTALELWVFLPKLLACWDYRHILPHHT